MIGSSRDGQRDHRGDGVQRNEEPEERAAGIVKVLLPCVEVLDGVEEGSVRLKSDQHLAKYRAQSSSSVSVARGRTATDPS